MYEPDKRLSAESATALDGNLKSAAGISSRVHRTNSSASQGWKTRGAQEVKAAEAEILIEWANENGMMLVSAPRLAKWKSQG